MVAAGGWLAGCSGYATNPLYPPDFPPPIHTDDACTVVAGRYLNLGEPALAERLPNTSPILIDNLFPSARDMFGVDHVDIAFGPDRVLAARAYRGAELIGEAGYAESPDGLACGPAGAVIQPRSLTLQKAEDGSLIVHIDARPLQYLVTPSQFATANWMRFKPTP